MFSKSPFLCRAVDFRCSILAVALALATSLLWPGAGRGQDPVADDFQPNFRPTLHVSRAPGAIQIDGDLSDAGWAGAAVADHFTETNPRSEVRPPVDSHVLVTFDDQHLYLGFVAQDDPSTIRASLRDRDQMWQDDYFGILLDTYGDSAWAYFLFANPYGIQGDTRFSSTGGEDETFDIIYYSEARITEDGYQIEMAIPFKSLRFPDKPAQEWRVSFWRTHPRASRATYSWAAMKRGDPCFPCQFGTLTGIEGVEPGGALELLPSFTGFQTGALNDSDDPESGFDNDKADGELSLNARYAFAGGLTVDGTLNPDFSQVESDAGQIDANTTFALFFPEKRPFFQEGADLFNTWVNAVYTRSINDPQVAVKLTGRKGRTSLAYIGARDERTPILLPFEERSFVGQADKSISNVLRARQTFGQSSQIGALLTDRRLQRGGSGTLGGFDGVFRLLDNYRLEWQAVASHVNEPEDATLTSDVNGMTFDDGAHTADFDGESFWGWAQYTSLERSGRTWNFDFDYWAYSPTFRADSGFETRNDDRRVSMWQGLNFYPETRLVDRISTSVFARRNWNFRGVRKRELIQPSLELSLKSQTFIDLEYTIENERFQGTDVRGINRFNFYINSNFSEPVRLGAFWQTGKFISRNSDPPTRAQGNLVNLWGTLKPANRLVIEPSFDYFALDRDDNGEEIFSGFITRTRLSLQFNRELFLRFIVEYNDFNESLSVEPLLTYKVNPFTLFFVGSTLGYQDFDDPTDRFRHTDRQFFAKVQYFWRL